MAKKTRKQKQRAATRRPGAPVTAPAAAARPVVAPAPPTQRRAQPLVLPETILPLPGVELEIESEPVDDEPVDDGPVAATPEDFAPVSDGAARRRVQRVNPAAQPRQTRGQVSAAAMFQPLDSEEAAIPFDRVPYVPSDLRRVAIIASLMVGLILIAAFVVTRVNP
jgi:hypothetical protein